MRSRTSKLVMVFWTTQNVEKMRKKNKENDEKYIQQKFLLKHQF